MLGNFRQKMLAVWISSSIFAALMALVLALYLNAPLWELCSYEICKEIPMMYP